MLNIGDKAPEFNLASSSGENVALKNLKGSWVVLYFYPKDMTPGCTTEACDFRDFHGDFNKMGVKVLGVSPDSVKSHDKFIGKHELPFELLSDEGKTMLEAYGVWKEKSMYGKKYMGVERTTTIIDPQGKVAAIWNKVSVTGHVKEVLEKLKELQ